MSLNVWALTIVKALGADYGAAQVVFLRAIVGLAVLAPFLWRGRHAFQAVPDLPLQVLRVALSAATLTASYFAVARVPLALFTTMNFTRPLVVMLMAALILGDRITPRQWVAAGVAMAGVVVALEPRGTGVGPGLFALAAVVLTGSGAVIVTRRLRETPVLVLMTFYTIGLAVFTAPFASVTWTQIADGHLLPIMAVGVFAQAAQSCFLRAHYHGEAGVLSVLGYLGLPLSVTVGYLVFNEAPTPRFMIGAALVVLAAASLARRPKL